MATKAIKPRKPSPRAALTPKQAAFAFWMVSAACYGNGTESARRAGYKGDDNVLGVVAYENLRKPKITVEIQRLERAAFKGADITVEKVLCDVELQRRHALATGQIAPAVRCSELQGKYLKMWVEKIEHVQALEDIPMTELVRLAHEIAEKAGIDIAALFSGLESDHGISPDLPGSNTTH